jgi:hypothetical protein
MRSIVFGAIGCFATMHGAGQMQIGEFCPTPRNLVLDASFEIPCRGTIVSKMRDGRLIAKAQCEDPESPSALMVFLVHDMDRLMLTMMNQQTEYRLLTNHKRGKSNGNYPLIMELAHNGHRRQITVRYLPREQVSSDQYEKIEGFCQLLEL